MPNASVLLSSHVDNRSPSNLLVKAMHGDGGCLSGLEVARRR